MIEITGAASDASQLQEQKTTQPSETGSPLTAYKLLAPLRLEHQAILDQLEAVETAVRKANMRIIHALLSELLLTFDTHCSREEETLVRAICQARGEDWLQSSIHSQHKLLIESLSDLLDGDKKSLSVLEARTAEFIHSLRAHISAEENVLFWLAEQSLGVREISDLSAVA